jgi:hypothetical protein
MAILSEITSLWMRNPPEEWLFCQESPQRNVYTSRIYKLMEYQLTVKKPPEEWNSARNYLLMDADSDRQDQNAQNNLQLAILMLFSTNVNLKE